MRVLTCVLSGLAIRGVYSKDGRSCPRAKDSSPVFPLVSATGHSSRSVLHCLPPPHISVQNIEDASEMAHEKRAILCDTTTQKNGHEHDTFQCLDNRGKRVVFKQRRRAPRLLKDCEILGERVDCWVLERSVHNEARRRIEQVQSSCRRPCAILSLAEWVNVEDTVVTMYDRQGYRKTLLAEDLRRGGAKEEPYWPYTLLKFPYERMSLQGLERAKKITKTLCWQLLNGVSALHQKGVVHQDLTSNNVYFSPEDGSLVISDFSVSDYRHLDIVGLQFIRANTYNFDTSPFPPLDLNDREDVDLYYLNKRVLELCKGFLNSYASKKGLSDDDYKCLLVFKKQFLDLYEKMKNRRLSIKGLKKELTLIFGKKRVSKKSMQATFYE